MIYLRSSLLRSGLARDPARLCSQCFSRLSPSRRPVAVRSFFSSSRLRAGIADHESTPSTVQKTYFSANRTADGLLASLSAVNSSPRSIADNALSQGAASSESITSQSTSQELPHRRRKRLKEEAAKNNAAETELPPDASSQLSTLSSALPATSLRRKLAAFLALTKPRLSFLIVLTTTSAYGMYPISSLLTLDPSMTPLPTLSTSTLTFLYLTTGTFLSSCSANTLNMLLEPKYDALMSRTRNRP